MCTCPMFVGQTFDFGYTNDWCVHCTHHRSHHGFAGCLHTTMLDLYRHSAPGDIRLSMFPGWWHTPIKSLPPVPPTKPCSECNGLGVVKVETRVCEHCEVAVVVGEKHQCLGQVVHELKELKKKLNLEE